MSRNAALLVAVVLMATACERNKTPDLVRGAGAPVPTAASPAIPPPDPGATAKPAGTTDSRPTASRPKAAGGKAAGSTASTRARRPSGESLSDDPCAGLDGGELDDCLGFDASQSHDDTAGRDFTDEQRKRDRALLERDARDAAEGESTYDPQEELPPGEAYDEGADDGYYPGGDEPPPDDDASW